MPITKYRIAPSRCQSCFISLMTVCVLLLQETRDGELVVLHDLTSFLSGAKGSPLNVKTVEKLERAGIDLNNAHVKVRIPGPTW